MLQQTQVTTVIPYFERFLQSFPTLTALAQADEQDVLRLWAGLGYYRRARDLHRAARVIVQEYGGQFPEDPSVLRRLPGIGRYTLGAVLSQAFDRRLPIVEANSQRVLCRLFALEGDPRRGPLRSRLWDLAEQLLPAHHSGDFNQALMELGALVCTPSEPQCSRCPVAALCEARQQGIQNRVPFLPPAPKRVEIAEVAAIVRRRRQVLLVQRPETARWSGLWEFPHGELARGENHEPAAMRMLAEMTGIDASLGPELLTLRYSVTRHRFTLLCFEATYLRGRFRSSFYRAAAWANPNQLQSYPLSSPQRRLAQALVQPAQKRLF